MDFLDPRKKRAHLIRLYIGYALMALAIGFGAVVLLYTSYGYGVDRHTGKVIQNGLVFVSSQPDGAAINIVEKNGKTQPETHTNTKMTIPAGEYNVALSKEGYRNWQRSFTLDGGSVERLMYPLLFPEKLETKDDELYADQPTLITSSPDRHWTMILKSGSVTDFDIYDVNKEDPSPAPISIPANVMSPGAAQSIKVVEWSTDNKHVLLRHNFDAAHEFILFNRETPSESINIDKHFNVPPAEVGLYDKGIDQVYLLTTEGVLNRAQLKNKQSVVLAQHVINFKPHGSDMIEYVSNETTPKTGKVSVKLRTNETEYTLRELPANTQYLLDLARFDDHWYVVVGAQSDNKVYVYQDPLDILKQKNSQVNAPARTMRIDNPSKVGFSANARFISAQGSKNFTVYDAEADRQYRYEINKSLDPVYPATWMDGHRMTAVADGKIIVFDFDGSNLQTLNEAVPGTLPTFDRDYTAIYALSPSTDVKGRSAFTRTSLLVKK